MTVFEKVKNVVKNVLGIQKITNPNSERLTFISSEETVWKQHVEEYKVWWIADSDELNNFYNVRRLGGYQKEPIYNENKLQYFWAKAVDETQPIKKIHSGIPRASIVTMVNCLQDVVIECPECQDKIDKILEVNNFSALLNQEARPLTMVEGDGAWKVIFDKSVSSVPLIQYYEALDVEYIEKQGVEIGIVYKDYYKYQDKNYMLLEIRRKENGNAIIEYELYKLEKNNEVEKVDLETIPELCSLPKEGYILPGIDMVLGVKCKYFNDPINKTRGLSVLSGKLDVADDMDMLVSVEGMTEENSGPVEYYPVDLLKRDKNGKPEMPKVFGRKFIKKPVVPSSDGTMDGKIDTSAPNLNFQQYSDALVNKTQLFLSGWLSPASMGIDISRKDNAEAQREKEKVTIMTRNNIIPCEREQTKKLMKICLMLQEYMDTGSISIKDYNISVKHNDFATPTFETMSQILTPMLTAGAISSQLFVDRLYGDSLSDAQKLREVAAIDDRRKQEEMNIGDMFANEPTGNMAESKPEEETTPEFAE